MSKKTAAEASLLFWEVENPSTVDENSSGDAIHHASGPFDSNQFWDCERDQSQARFYASQFS